MKKLIKIFAVVLVLGFGSNASAAGEDKLAKAKGIAEMLSVYTGVANLQLVQLSSEYKCLDENFSNRWKKLNMELAQIIDLDSEFAKFIADRTETAELESIENVLNSNEGRAFLNELKYPTLNESGDINYPTIETTKNEGLKSLTVIFAAFMQSGVVENKLSEQNEEMSNKIKELDGLVFS